MGFKENKHWKTFICYRVLKSPETRKLIRYSMPLAEVLYNCIKDDHDLMPVLYEESCKKESFSYDEPGIREIMPGIQTFVPVITPDFFDEIIDSAYLYINRDLDAEKYDALPVCIKEMAHAIRCGCYFYPIYIEKDSVSFYQQKERRKTVTKILASIVRSLPGYDDRVFIEEKCESFITEFFTRVNALTVGTETIDRILTNKDDEREELINRFSEEFNQKINRRKKEERSGKNPFIRKLLTDLSDLHRVIRQNGQELAYRNNIMDTKAYERLSLYKNPQYYCISSAFILGVESLKQENETASGKGRGFVDIKNACYANNQDNDYYYWPVSLCTDREKGENPSFFSVCAISFGAMMLNNWYYYDRALCSEVANADTGVDPDEILGNINKAINLLLSLRDYENMSWVSTWDFGQKVGAVDGTINQTTLSLSTLITCGFLDLRSVDNNLEMLFNRIRFIDNSLLWLKSKRRKASIDRVEAYYWGNGCTDEFNLSLTLFCLDVLMKYYAKIRKEVPVNHAASLQRIRNMPFTTYCDAVKNTIDGIVLYLNKTVPGMIASAEGDHDRLLIWSKVLKSYCGYISFETMNRQADPDYDPEEGAGETFEQAVRLSREAVSFIYRNRELIRSFDPQNCKMLIERFPHITYEGKDAGDCDYYDNCAELLAIDAMIKAAEQGICGTGDEPFTLEDLYKGIEEAIEWFRKTRVRKLIPRFPTVLGHNDLLSPIYAFYYFRMVIYDCVKLFSEAGYEAD